MSHQELGTLAESYRNSFVIDSMTVFMIAIKAVKYFQLQRDLALLKENGITHVRDARP